MLCSLLTETCTISPFNLKEEYRVVLFAWNFSGLCAIVPAALSYTHEHNGKGYSLFITGPDI